jgi:hypothetical protein
MKKWFLLVLSAFSFTWVAGDALAQDKAGKRNPANQIVTQFMKQLEKAELSADQTAKIKELMTKAATEVNAKRAEAGISADMLKKRVEAAKAAKESGKKGKEMQASTLSAMGLTDAQKQVFTDTEATLGKARVEIGKMLTAEQMAKLSEQFQRTLKEAAGRKGKKGKA